MPEQELRRLQKIAEDQQRKKSRIEGRVDGLMDELKSEGYSSIEEARKALDILNQKLSTQDKLFKRKLNEFRRKHDKTISEYNQ